MRHRGYGDQVLLLDLHEGGLTDTPYKLDLDTIVLDCLAVFRAYDDLGLRMWRQVQVRGSVHVIDKHAQWEGFKQYKISDIH